MRKQERAEGTDKSDDDEEDEEKSDPGEEDPSQWSERGIAGFERTEAYKRRHKRSPESDVSLPATALGKSAVRKVWGSVKLKNARKCTHPDCDKRIKKGCSCEELCTLEEYDVAGVLMCQECFRNDVFHEEAAGAHWDATNWDGGTMGLRNVKPMEWLP